MYACVPRTGPASPSARATPRSTSDGRDPLVVDDQVARVDVAVDPAVRVEVRDRVAARA